MHKLFTRLIAKSNRLTAWVILARYHAMSAEGKRLFVQELDRLEAEIKAKRQAQQ